MATTEAIEFSVVGEHRDGHGHLLLLGDDGRFYEYVMSQCEVSPTELDASWEIDPALSGDLRFIVPDCVDESAP